MFIIPPSSLLHAAPELNPTIAEHAAAAVACTTSQGKPIKRLMVADMGRPNSSKRLFVFDLTDPQHPKLTSRDLVAHGYGSDPKKTGQATQFSNIPESGMTSLGWYQVAEPYIGKHGQSWHLDGLTPGWNDHARARNVELHPAPYVSAGHIGYSAGCIALPPKALQALSKPGFQDTYLWVDSAQVDAGLTQSATLNCTAATVMRWHDDVRLWAGSVLQSLNLGFGWPQLVSR